MAWVESKILGRQLWADGLITLQLEAVVAAFIPGQFVNLGLDLGGERVKRSYSLASAPGAPSEFYLSHVPAGILTSPLFARQPGETVWIDDRALGFFTLQHVPDARDLWLLATGTGLGPFLAMLRAPDIWQRFAHVVLVHGVREVAHLGYAALLETWARQHGEQFTYVPVVSREAAPSGALAGRLPQLIASGELERRTELGLTLEHSHVLLCGNPSMITDVTAVLAERGMQKHRPRKPGHFSFESYW